MNKLSQRDLRQNALFKKVEQHFEKLFAGEGELTDAVEPVLSPSGRRVAFAGKYVTSLEGEPFFKLCIFDVAKSKIKKVPGKKCRSRFPQWSPDDNNIAFLSDEDRAGHFQLRIYDSSAGKITAPPVVNGIAEYCFWSPEGRRILVGMAAAGADLAGAQGSGSHAGDSDGLPSWVPEVQSTSAQDQRRSLVLFDPAKRKMIPLDLGKNVWEATWCGEDSIIAVVTAEEGEWSWYFAELVRYDIKTHKVETLHRSRSRQIGIPRATRSGSRIAFIEAVCSDRMIIAGDVVLMETGHSTAKKVIDTLGVDVMQVQWLDEHRLFFIGLQNLDTVAGEYDTTTGTARQLWRSEETCGSYQTDAFASDAGITLVLQSYTRYPELVVIKDGEIRASHSFAHSGADYVKRIGSTLHKKTWKGRDGLSCEGFLITPKTPGPHPLIVRVHGGPISAFRNFWMMNNALNPLLLKNGFAIFCPNPRGSSGKGQEFAERVVGDMCGEDAHDILQGVQKLVSEGLVDDKRVGVTGGSYGGLMTCWLVTQSNRFAAAVAHAPVTDWFSQHYTSNIGFWDQWFLGGPPPNNPEYIKRSPTFFASSVKTPTLITGGMKDHCTPPGQAIEFYNALVEAQAPAQLVLYPEEGHHLHRLEAQIDQATRILGWFSHHLGI